MAVFKGMDPVKADGLQAIQEDESHLQSESTNGSDNGQRIRMHMPRMARKEAPIQHNIHPQNKLVIQTYMLRVKLGGQTGTSQSKKCQARASRSIEVKTPDTEFNIHC
jgi:hypothetical protein